MKKRIKELRKSLKLTQTEFGKKIGVRGNTIANYENSLRTPSNAVVSAICREFGVSEHWLRTGEGEMRAQQSDDLVSQLADQYNLGPNARALLAAAAGKIGALDEATCFALLKSLDLPTNNPDSIKSEVILWNKE